MGKLTYPRGTNFAITHTYQKNGVNSSDGTKLFFTVKASEYDTDVADTSAIISKTITMSGATNVITILPTDLADTVAPGAYFYDLKVSDSVAGLLLVDSGKFVLTATPTNRLS